MKRRRCSSLAAPSLAAPAAAARTPSRRTTRARSPCKVVDQIVHNRYDTAWGDLHPVDQKVAPLAEYVQLRDGGRRCSPVPRSTKVVSISDESVGLGDGSFVQTQGGRTCGSASPAASTLVHTVHVVATTAKWTWILPSCRFRDYRADKCPVDAGSSPPPSTSCANLGSPRSRPGEALGMTWSASPAARLDPGSRRARARGAARPAAGTRRPRRRAGTARSRSRRGARNQSQTRSTSFSGAEAPEVMPTTSTPSSQLSSISVSSSIRCAATPPARATSTSRFEFDELREPITSSRSISASISFTAHCRLEVA